MPQFHGVEIFPRLAKAMTEKNPRAKGLSAQGNSFSWEVRSSGIVRSGFVRDIVQKKRPAGRRKSWFESARIPERKGR